MSRQIRACEVKVGDRITDAATPSGPFYRVVKVNAKSLVLDIRDDAEMQSAAGAEFYGSLDTVRISIRLSDVVILEG